MPVRIANLSFAYPDRPVLTALSCALKAGLTLLTAGEGKGKTSLAKILGGELTAIDGDIWLRDVNCAGNAAVLHQHVYYVDSHTQDYEQMTVNAYIAHVAARFPGTRLDAFAGLAEGLSLTPHLDKQLFMLSTGTKRKVWLAGGLIASADLVVFDDPFAALDFASIRFATGKLNEVFCGNAAQVCIVMAYEKPQGLQFTQHIDLGA